MMYTLIFTFLTLFSTKCINCATGQAELINVKLQVPECNLLLELTYCPSNPKALQALLSQLNDLITSQTHLAGNKTIREEIEKLPGIQHPSAIANTLTLITRMLALSIKHSQDPNILYDANFLLKLALQERYSANTLTQERADQLLKILIQLLIKETASPDVTRVHEASCILRNFLTQVDNVTSTTISTLKDHILENTIPRTLYKLAQQQPSFSSEEKTSVLWLIEKVIASIKINYHPDVRVYTKTPGSPDLDGLISTQEICTLAPEELSKLVETRTAHEDPLVLAKKAILYAKANQEEYKRIKHIKNIQQKDLVQQINNYLEFFETVIRKCTFLDQKIISDIKTAFQTLVGTIEYKNCCAEVISSSQDIVLSGQNSTILATAQYDQKNMITYTQMKQASWKLITALKEKEALSNTEYLIILQQLILNTDTTIQMEASKLLNELLQTIVTSEDLDALHAFLVSTSNKNSLIKINEIAVKHYTQNTAKSALARDILFWVADNSDRETYNKIEKILVETGKIDDIHDFVTTHSYPPTFLAQINILAINGLSNTNETMRETARSLIAALIKHTPSTDPLCIKARQLLEGPPTDSKLKIILALLVKGMIDDYQILLPILRISEKERLYLTIQSYIRFVITSLNPLKQMPQNAEIVLDAIITSSSEKEINDVVNDLDSVPTQMKLIFLTPSDSHKSEPRDGKSRIDTMFDSLIMQALDPQNNSLDAIITLLNLMRYKIIKDPESCSKYLNRVKDILKTHRTKDKINVQEDVFIPLLLEELSQYFKDEQTIKKLIQEIKEITTNNGKQSTSRQLALDEKS